MKRKTAPDMSLSSRVDVLEHTVGEVKSVVNDIAKTLNRYIEKDHERPRPIPFREIVVTMGATLAVVWGVLEFMDKRQSSELAPYKWRIEQLERLVGQDRQS